MKCNKCGYETEQDFVFCPTCGEEQKKEPEINTAAEKIFPALKDNLFLAMCILLTVSAGCTLLAGGGIPVITVLFAIFMWIVRQKAQEGVVDVANMRHISGTVYANYVVTNVVCILGLVCLGITAISFAIVGAESISMVLTNVAVLWESVNNPTGKLAGLITGFASIVAWIIIILCAVIFAVALILNQKGYRKLHILAKSVYMGVQNNDLKFTEHIKSAKTWLWVFAILSCVNAVGSMSNLLTFVSAGCTAAATVIAAVLVGKYLLDGK